MADRKFVDAPGGAAVIGDISATTSIFAIGSTTPGALTSQYLTAGLMAQWQRSTGFATAITAAASPAAINWVFQNGSGADNAPGAFTITAPMGTGAAVPPG